MMPERRSERKPKARILVFGNPILVFGNPLVKKDCLPLKILPMLREAMPHIEFIEFDCSENLENEGPNIFILDVAEGIDKPTVVKNLQVLKDDCRLSLHDLGLSASLKLLKALGIIKDVTIFCVPPKMPEKKALQQIKAMIEKNIE